MLFLILASTLGISTGVAQISPATPPLTEVARNDPAWTMLRQKEEEIRASYREHNPHLKPGFVVSGEFSAPSLTKLFPGYRFLTLVWNEERDETVKEPDGVFDQGTPGLSTILAYDNERRKPTEFQPYGNYEEYGSFLAKHKVKLATDADARVIWDAFCDLHGKQWQKQGIKRKHEKAWHLGTTTIEGTCYYYEVLLDDQKQVVSGQLRSEDAPGGKVQ